MAWGPGPACDRVAIIGLGLIGSSLGLAIREARLAPVVVGYDLSPATARRSLSMRAVDCLAGSPQEAAGGADLVILAVPVAEMSALIPLVAGAMPAGSILTDAGSAKEDVVRAMDRAVGSGGGYAGGHPMAGSERSGPGSASAALIAGCRYVLCPGPRTDGELLRRLQAFLDAIPVHTTIMSPGEHDRSVAWVSHLPYMAAVALCLAVKRGLGNDGERLKLAAGSFRDGTRTAASEPRMAGDYCFSNRARVAGALRALALEIDGLAGALEAGDRGSLDRLLVEARELRLRAGL